MKLWITIFGIFITFAGVFLPSAAVLKIPAHLIHCYRNVSTQPLAPQNLQVLIELLRKVENQNIDIRDLAVSLVHKLKVDGIQRSPGIQETEYVTPYDANGNQVPKDEILLKLISPKDQMINFENYLNPDELCHLHKLISSSVDSFERGDEAKTCRKYNSVNPDKVLISKTGQVYVIKRKISQCPIEKGTIRTTQFGTLSPGTVIASIAAGMEPQRVAISEFLNYENPGATEHLLYNPGRIENTFAANIAGDLAEVCTYQSPYYETNVKIGTSGFWNDTDYPVTRYLEENVVLNWAMTDAEILGGIDGMAIGSNIRGWVHKIQKLRLSEVLEMYYSIKGVPNLSIEQGNQWNRLTMNNTGQYDSMSESGCDRIKSMRRISKDKLKEQTFNFAQTLQQFSTTVNADQELLRSACDAAVEKFYVYAQDLVLKTTKCKNCSRHPLDLTVVLDGSRNQFENMMLISSLTEMVDVSKFGSRIAVVNGNSGKYMVNPTHSVMQVFQDLKSSYGNFPTFLSLEQSLLSISSHMDAENSNKTNDWSGLSQVILVVSQNQQISTDAFDRAKTILQGEYTKYHDLYFIFLTDIPDTYKELVSTLSSYPEAFRKSHFLYVESSRKEPSEFNIPLMRTFRNIKKYLHIPPCIKGRGPDSYPDTTLDSYEDYVSRQQDNYYQINSQQLSLNKHFFVKFQGVSYGSITVCMERTHDNLECLSTLYNEFESVQFNITSNCNDPFVYCEPITFRVEMETSYVRCTEDDCRYPDQVRYLVQMGDMSCNEGVAATFVSWAVVSLGLLFVKYLSM